MNFVALIFSNQQSVLWDGLGPSLIRIPEVSNLMGKAQEILDRIGLQNIDLITEFSQNADGWRDRPEWRQFLSGLIQIAFFQRYCRRQGEPTFLIGEIQGDGAVLVCAQQKTLEEYVIESQLVRQRKRSSLSLAIAPNEKELPQLQGRALAEFGAFEKTGSDENMWTPIFEKTKDLRQLMTQLSESRNLRQFIEVGLQAQVKSAEGVLMECQIASTFDVDPMLDWLWGESQALASSH